MAANMDETSDAELWQQASSENKQERAEALIEIAYRKQERGEVGQSLSAAGTARVLFAELDMPAAEARAGWFEARAHFEHEVYESVVEVLNRTIELYRTYAGEVELADAIFLQGQAYACLVMAHQAEEAFKNALELYRSNGRFTLAGIAALDLGELQGGLGRQRDALATLRDCLTIFQEGSDLVGSGRAHDRIAAALIDLGEIDDAIEHLREALRIFEYIEDAPRWTWAQYRLGWTLVTRGKDDEAVPLLTEASRWYKEQGYFGRAADADNQLAHALTNQGKEAEALELYRKTRAVYAGLGLSGNARWVDGNIAANLLRANEPEEALVIYRRLLAESKEADDHYLVRAVSVRMANALRALETFEAFEEALQVLDASPVEEWGDGRTDTVYQLDAYRGVYLDMGNMEKAEEYANKVLDFGVESGFMSFTANAYRTLGTIEHDRGNADKAKVLVAQAIALYLAAGDDTKARELSQQLMPGGGASSGADILRPAVETPEGSASASAGSSDPELDFGEGWADGQ
jgi:tetratricopeptide (TPR) repeat protein